VTAFWNSNRGKKLLKFRLRTPPPPHPSALKKKRKGGKRWCDSSPFPGGKESPPPRGKKPVAPSIQAGVPKTRNCLHFWEEGKEKTRFVYAGRKKESKSSCRGPRKRRHLLGSGGKQKCNAAFCLGGRTIVDSFVDEKRGPPRWTGRRDVLVNSWIGREKTFQAAKKRGGKEGKPDVLGTRPPS